MKKYYEAPVIQFEDFSMSTSIAANCEVIISNQSQGSCGVTGFGQPIFTSGFPDACKKKVEDGSKPELDNACYHIPSALNNIFNS